MRGTVAKRLRRQAEELTIGMSKIRTKAVYKELKSQYLIRKRFPDE